jgi:hypothetical protein
LSAKGSKGVLTLCIIHAKKGGGANVAYLALALHIAALWEIRSLEEFPVADLELIEPRLAMLRHAKYCECDEHDIAAKQERNEVGRERYFESSNEWYN